MTLYKILKAILKPLLKLVFLCRAKGLENTDVSGPLVICANHISLMDPLFIAVYLKRPITFMAKAELFKVPVLKYILKKCGVIALERNGGDAAMLRLAVRQLKAGAVIAIFPQGKRCRGVPPDQTQVKGGLGLLVSYSGASVLPVGIQSKNHRVLPFCPVKIVFGKPKRFDTQGERLKSDEIRKLSEDIFGDVIKLSDLIQKDLSND